MALAGFKSNLFYAELRCKTDELNSSPTAGHYCLFLFFSRQRWDQHSLGQCALECCITLAISFLFKGDLGLGDGWRPSGGSATVGPWTGTLEEGVAIFLTLCGNSMLQKAQQLGV